MGKEEGKWQLYGSCLFFFLKTGKEKCSRDLQEIVFHYRRLGDEREVFYPLGQTMLFFCHLSAYTHAPKSAFTVDTSICLSDRWCQTEKRRRGGCGGRLRAHRELMKRCFCHFSKSQSAHIPSVSCQPSHSVLFENYWTAFCHKRFKRNKNGELSVTLLCIQSAFFFSLSPNVLRAAFSFLSLRVHCCLVLKRLSKLQPGRTK